MLPSLQESLDGDEKELESSEEGGSAEERRLDPPPSSHYCLYSYRGSRCSARPPWWPRPGPAAHSGFRSLAAPKRSLLPSQPRSQALRALLASSHASWPPVLGFCARSSHASALCP